MCAPFPWDTLPISPSTPHHRQVHHGLNRVQSASVMSASYHHNTHVRPVVCARACTHSCVQTLHKFYQVERAEFIEALLLGPIFEKKNEPDGGAVFIGLVCAAIVLPCGKRESERERARARAREREISSEPCDFVAAFCGRITAAELEVSDCSLSATTGMCVLFLSLYRHDIAPPTIEELEQYRENISATIESVDDDDARAVRRPPASAKASPYYGGLVHKQSTCALMLSERIACVYYAEPVW